MRKIKQLFLFLIITLFTIKLGFAASSEEFKWKLNNLRWIAYSPSNFDPNKNKFPSEESIKKDLVLLYQYGFNGLVTYGADSTLGEIPLLAKEIGFQGLIMGIWDISSRDEIMAAILAEPYVDGYCVGNEGLNSRYDLESLNKVIAEIKTATNKPATTSEQIFDYANKNVVAIGDWVFPNIHPFLSEIHDPKKGVNWINKHYLGLKKRVPPDKSILFKETGWPTRGGSKANAANQKVFFLNLQKTSVPFVYFEAFDQTWKIHLPVEPYWGLFTTLRKPKKFASTLKHR